MLKCKQIQREKTQGLRENDTYSILTNFFNVLTADITSFVFERFTGQ